MVSNFQYKTVNGWTNGVAHYHDSAQWVTSLEALKEFSETSGRIITPGDIVLYKGLEAETLETYDNYLWLKTNSPTPFTVHEDKVELYVRCTYNRETHGGGVRTLYKKLSSPQIGSKVNIGGIATIRDYNVYNDSYLVEVKRDQIG